MREKQGWSLPRLGRKGKILRNLALTLVLVGLVWGALGCPLPPALAFRRLELRYLREPSQIVAQVEQNGDPFVVGFTSEEVVLGDLEGGALSFWNWPEEGTGLMVAAGLRNAYVPTTWLLSMDAPEKAVSARLELELSAWMTRIGFDGELLVLALPTALDGDYWQESWTYSVEGERLPCGEFLFRIDAQDQTPWQDAPRNGVGEQMALAQLSWESLYTWAEPGGEHNPEFLALATFYDQTGAEVGQARLSPLENTIQGG
ncbi:hypothetical protein [Flavonifractor sp. An100]|uniref:hypothetical protein n=1 Tax=Flavonifractor sp. An100 TaxID=1965538 RepID=UPI000B371999|nr:hypothetical protein [Flavonifractor sp. An100]OUQ78372.1 hypothetical protein B5E43_08850 [Flavonifractor sp. An100]